MKTQKLRLMNSAIALFMVLVLGALVVFAANTLYPNAKVVFSGIQIVTNKNTNTVQGFIDVSMRNMNATGVSFCVKYDKSLIELSSIDQNEPITSQPDMFDGTHKYFEQDTANFPQGVFIDTAIPAIPIEGSSPLFPVMGIADPEKGYFSMRFNIVSDFSGDYGAYIGEGDGGDNESTPSLKILANTGDGVRLGRISFQIKNPEALAKLPKAELAHLFEIVGFPEMYGDTVQMQEGVYITYVKEDGQVDFISHKDRYVGYELEIRPDLESIEAQVSDFTVSAYEIYQTGSIDDLYAFLNEKASVAILNYATGTKVPIAVRWDKADGQTDIYDKDGNQDQWYPQGGMTYRINRRYEENYSFGLTVTVTPVSLIGFSADNQSATYAIGAADFPETVVDLDLPGTARPILDTTLLNGGISKVDIASYTYDGAEIGTELPDDFGSVAKSYPFTGSIDLDALKSTYAWLTVGDSLDGRIAVVRNVVASEADLPPQISATAQTSPAGVMTITVTGDIDDTSAFEIKLPGDKVINTAADGVHYSYSYADGVGTITLSADSSVPDAETLAKAINLGERLGEFSIAAVKAVTTADGDMTVKSADVPFASNARENDYIGPETGSAVYGGENVYVFDYSLALSALFPVDDTATLPNTITLALPAHAVKTTYHGYDGSTPGELMTITVDGWAVASAEDEAGGVTKKFTGRLADTEYSNYGRVENPDNVMVTILYYTVPAANEDEITITPDTFVFNKQQEGYDYDRLQTKSFEIKNVGHTNIHGLSAVVSLADVAGGTEQVEAFVVSRALPPILNQDETVSLDITTKYGLKTGVYTAVVTLYSNNKALGEIHLTFEVTDKPVFDIYINAEDPDYGTARTENGSTTAEQGETVRIEATPVNPDDYRFVGWETEDGLIDAAEIKAPKASFVMPGHEVHITARFEETIGAKLRAEELYVLKTAEELSETKDNALQLRDDTWQAVAFDPAVRQYYLVVPNDVDSIKLWFSAFRQESVSAVKTVTNTTYRSGVAEPGAVTETIGEPDADNYYKSGGQALVLGPAENLVELTFTYDVPPEESDEGTVTRTYKLHIYRKIASDSNTGALAVFDYGNSPYGRIMRDPSLAGADDAATKANRGAKKQAFIDNGYRFTNEYVPTGTKANADYSTAAWNGGENFDLNDYALFVINSENFYDPGYLELKNSIGQDVTDAGLLAKSVKVNVLQESSANLQNANTDDFAFVAQETIALSSSGEITQLSEKRIRPDVYWMEYSYQDFDGSNIVVKKPLIILYSLGDVTVNRATNAADAKRIRERYASGKEIANGDTVSGYGLGAKVFKHRIVDANADGYVNMLDCNMVYKIEKDGAAAHKNLYQNIMSGELKP